MMRIQRAERGYSLMEVTVVLAIATVVLMAAYQMVEDAVRSSMFVENHNDLAVMAQRPVNAMQLVTYQAKTVFQNNTVGVTYLNNIKASLPTGFPMMANSIMPIATAAGNFAPDASGAANRQTGNCLLVAQQLPPLLIPYHYPLDTTTPTINFIADRYQFHLFYLSYNTTKDFEGSGKVLDLVHVTSKIYADRYQLNNLFNPPGGIGAFTTTQKSTIAGALNTAGITEAWDPTTGLTIGTAFYSLSSAGVLAVEASPAIGIKTTVSMLPELLGGRISGRMIYSVGFRQSFATGYNLKDPIPRYAFLDASIPNYPQGFETKLVGSGGAQKVLIRLVMMGNHGTHPTGISGRAPMLDSQEGFVISSVGYAS